MSNVLIIRLSAIGDVAMTIPVIYSVARANPEDSFTVLTQTSLIPLFMNHPSNVQLRGINIKTTEKRFAGVVRFANKLSKTIFDTVLDLHDVPRTRIIRFFMKLKGKKVYVIDKGRKERKELTRQHNKNLHPLRQMTDRYGDVFRRAGFRFHINFTSVFKEKTADLSEPDLLTGEKNIRIGIAPFARHRGKIYPPEKMEKVISILSGQGNTELFLFGGKGDEAVLLDQWASAYIHVTSVAGKYSLDKELSLISRLDLMVCMDSANMHFASLVNTRVISIWGATHPFAGFYGFNQQPEDALGLELPCRPCSAFGDKPCYRKDWACMNQLSPDFIVRKINQTFTL